MLNAHYSSIGQYRDVESLNYYQILLRKGRTEEEALRILAARSRDNGRTPMQWNSGTYGGFSEAEPWLSLSGAFREEITAEFQKEDPDSILSFYKMLISLRKKRPVIAEGTISFLETGNDMTLAYERELGSDKIAVFCNLGKEEQTVLIGKEWIDGKLLLENYRERQKTPESEVFVMKPYELTVLEK